MAGKDLGQGVVLISSVFQSSVLFLNLGSLCLISLGTQQGHMIRQGISEAGGHCRCWLLVCVVGFYMGYHRPEGRLW